MNKELKIIGTEKFINLELNYYNSFENPLFLASDVAKILQERDGYTVARKVNESEKVKKIIATNGRNQSVIFITKNGLLQLINNTRKLSENKKSSLINAICPNSIIIKDAKETNFLNELEQALEPFNIKGIRQYPVLNYRIDYYIPLLNISVEYDEQQHFTETNQEKDKIREIEISKEIGCNFIRCDYRKTNAYNIGYVIKKIFDKKGEM